MALLDGLSSAAKGSTVTITLDMTLLLALPSVVADDYFSKAGNIRKVKVVYKSTEDHQKVDLVFDATQSLPEAQMTFSIHARDNFYLAEIILMDFDNGYFPVASQDLSPEFNISIAAPVASWHLSYTPSGSLVGTVPTDSDTYANGSRAFVKGNTGSLAVDNREFLGWSDNPDNSGYLYPAGFKAYMGGDLTLYPIWTESPTVASEFEYKNTANTPVKLVHSELGATIYGIGREFTVLETTTLSHVSFRVDKIGLPSFVLNAQIWNSDFNAITGSDNFVDVASLPGSVTDIVFTFNQENTVKLPAGKYYIVITAFNIYQADDLNNIRMHFSSNSPGSRLLLDEENGVSNDYGDGWDYTLYKNPTIIPSALYNFEADPVVDAYENKAVVSLLGSAAKSSITPPVYFGSDFGSLALNKSPDALKSVYPSNIYTGGDFTFECWIYSADYSSQEGSFTTTIAHLNTNGGPGGIHIQTRNGGYIAIDNGLESGSMTANPVLTSGQWDKISVEKIDSFLLVHVNGQVVLTAAAQSYPSCNELLLGQYMESADRNVVGNFMGNLDDVRFTDGRGLYVNSYIYNNWMVTSPMYVETRVAYSTSSGSITDLGFFNGPYTQGISFSPTSTGLLEKIVVPASAGAPGINASGTVTVRMFNSYEDIRNANFFVESNQVDMSTISQYPSGLQELTFTFPNTSTLNASSTYYAMFIFSDVGSGLHTKGDTGSGDVNYSYVVNNTTENFSGYNIEASVYVTQPLPTYTVTYNANGATSGTVPADGSAVFADSFTVSDNTGSLAQEGYAIANWNSAADGSGQTYYMGSSYQLFNNLTLYAQWQPSFSITYDANGATSGTVPVDTNAYINNGAIIYLQDNVGSLAKDGYVFMGWWPAIDGGGNYYNSQTGIQVTEATTFYAQWQVAYTLTYDADGADGGSVPVDSNLYGPGVQTHLLGNTGSLTKTGYAFAGWIIQDVLDPSSGLYVGTTYQPGHYVNVFSNITIYAKWLPTYTIAYDANGADSGTAPVDTNKYISGQRSLILGNTGSLSLSHYIFDGWNTSPDGSGTNYGAGSRPVMSSNLTLYAKWAYGYTVTYDANGAESGTVPVDTQAYLYSQNATVRDNVGSLTKTNYWFTGWLGSINGGTPFATLIGGGVTMTGDLILSAGWKAYYSITYDSYGADSGTVPDTTYYRPVPSYITTTISGNVGNLTKAGYVFAGWSVNKDSYRATHPVGSNFLANHSVYLYPVWLPVFTLSFDSSSADSGTVPVDELHTYATTVDVASVGNPGSLVKDGFTFAGWGWSPDGSPVTSFGIYGNTILYALWV